MTSTSFDLGTPAVTTSSTSVTSSSPASQFTMAGHTFIQSPFGSSTAVSTSSSGGPYLFTLSQSTEDTRAKTPDFGFGRKPTVKKEKHKPSGEGSPFPKPLCAWRKVEWTEEERKSLLDRLSSYAPSPRDVPQARILLLGPAGSGKSSFISSMQSVCDGRVSNRAMVGHGASPGFTRKLQSFPLRVQDNGRGRSSALVLCDMMGFGDDALSGPTLHHMLGVIKGHAPEGFEFRAEEALSSDTEGYIKRPGLKEQIHCVAFVLDASRVRCGTYSKGIKGTFQQLRRYISDMGVHQVVLLTHVDQICPETAQDTSEVYNSIFVRDTIYKAAELVGISVSSVVPVRNYWCELDLDLCSDVLLLRAMDHILHYTELLFTEERQSSSKHQYD